MHCWWECKLVQPLWKTVRRFVKKLKTDLPYDPAITLLGIYPRDTGVLIHRGTCTPMFIAALSTVAKLWKEPKYLSTDEWVKKLWFIYTMEYYLAMRKNEIWPFFQYMNFIVKLVSIQHPVLIPTSSLLNAHHPFSPLPCPPHQPSVCFLYLRVSYGLPPSLSVTIFTPPSSMVFC